MIYLIATIAICGILAAWYLRTRWAKRVSLSYPEGHPDAVTWERDSLTLTVIRIAPLGEGTPHYCGYVRFPKRPLKEKSYLGIVKYVPVHGGVTYARQSPDGSMVYGFDCAHKGDEEDENCKDLAWVRQETERMAASIIVASNYEPDLRRVKRAEARLGIVMAYHLEMHNMGIEFDAENNKLASLAFMTGNI